MFGTFRMLLALFVVLTHLGINPGGFYPGTMAVIGFYVISGYVISFLLLHRLQKISVRTFYFERIVRIYPQFLLHLILAIIIIRVLDFESPFTKNPVTVQTIVLNLSLIPLQAKAFFSYISEALYVPVSWSLSLEVSFYLIAPLLIVRNWMPFFAILSFIIFMLGALGYLHTHTYTYATIFGTLQFFIIGAWLQQKNYRLLTIWSIAMLILGCLVTLTSSWKPSHIQETFSGAFLCLFALVILRNFRDGPYQKIDDFCGNISYPIFLNHFIFIWIFQAFNISYDSFFGQLSLVSLSLISAILAYIIIERPIAGFRRSLRVERQ